MLVICVNNCPSADSINNIKTGFKQLKSDLSEYVQNYKPHTRQVFLTLLLAIVIKQVTS
tara:strand:- start:47 stop:223 length:177 start_codon:yes stop_codon:yes gene_type:complete